MKKTLNIIIGILLIMHIVFTGRVILMISAVPSLGLAGILGVLIDLMILYYTFIGYKKPHGNMLRYAFFFFGVIELIQSVTYPMNTYVALFLCAVGIVAVYVSGRLDKVKKNRTLCFIGMSFCVAWIIGFIKVGFGDIEGIVKDFSYYSLIIFSACGPLIQLMALYLSYISRFEAHQEAGLLDK